MNGFKREERWGEQGGRREGMGERTRREEVRESN
jgi:hypothetical protein